MASRDEQRRALARVVAMAWQDSAYKERLVANPAAAFAELGLDLPRGVTYHVHVNTATHQHFVLPAQPQTQALIEDALNSGLAWIFTTCIIGWPPGGPR